MSLGVFFLFFFTFLLSPSLAQSQSSVPPAAAQVPIDLDRFITRFLATTEDYERVFQNLATEETKTIEVYGPSGQVEKRRQIVSDLVVYHSSRHGTDTTTEYRDVQIVDRKVVAKRGERALKLLTNAAKADTLDAELGAIDRETSRYEFNRRLRGFTIHQGGVFKQRRLAFQVESVGREQIAGHDVVVLDYRQIEPIPGFQLPMPKELSQTRPLHRGRLWIDSETAQLWRVLWELVVPSPAAREPLVMIRQESTYRPSSFGILVPQLIVFDWLTRFSHPKNGAPSLALSERVTFTYGAFRRFGVATDEDIKVPPAPGR